MNIFKNIQEMTTKGIWICFFLIFLISCTKDENEIEPSPSSGQATISFSLDTQTIISRAEVDEYENKVNSLYILVFEKKDNQYICQEKATATLQQNGNYTVSLYPTEEDTRLYFLANIDINGFSPTINKTEEEIKEHFIMAYPDKDEADMELIPMFGKSDMPDGLNAGETIELDPVEIVRSLAAITVENEATKFLLTSIQGYRVNSHLQIIPDQLDTENKVTQPSIPAESETKITSKRIAVEEGTDKLEGLYLPESNPITDTELQISEATCLIIGGHYDEDETETYYRVDFGSSTTFGQLLRNYRYNIVITNVTGPGTTHPEEAIEINIKYTIDDWTNSNHPIEL